MAGTPKNEPNKIRKEMERDNNEVAQDGVESTASLLQGGWLSCKVDEAARACYERVKITAFVGIKTLESNPWNREIHEQIKTNKSNKFSSSGVNICEAPKGQEGREINQNF